ncbi:MULTISPECIES: hypothetical protein [Methylosinus]|uniref:Response regulator receiver protein n=1 Tax=Methylosinus trichosporium (strain ATCC 35070 / NCIMB 11131 / UNIQEM 75 / OB3b) TaxID=595536 RepID=A0A2D2D246_METT3|nr:MULTISPECIES: hypothetical protein [Methylosinus]ATQ69060.1 response regulator receiver protein [Methylosinus trichosporium OB3b]OBS51913.1 hypothetical protein A8B73_13910 [Methylosinus sp. 3S-1]
MTGAVPSLTKTYPDGKPYCRMPEVEEQIARLAELPFDEIVERGHISIRSHPQFVKPEALMHFLRATRLDNRDTRFDALFPLVLRRLLLALPKCERKVGEDIRIDGALSDVEDRVRGRFLELVALDRAGGDRMDFFEVHFDEAVAKLRMKAAKAVGGRARRNVALEGDADSGELPEAVERAVGSFDDPDDAFLSDPIFRKRLYPEIDRLKPEQKRVITMLLANMQTHSSDPSAPTISKALGCDERTVRNRRRDAIVALRMALGLGADQ